MSAIVTERDPGGGRAARNAIALTAATLVARLSAFVLGIALARGVGTTSYGEYGFAAALAIVLTPIADLGLTPYLTREVARDRSVAEGALRTIFLTKALTTLVVLLAVFGVAAATTDSKTTIAVVGLIVVAGMADGTSLLVYGYFGGRERMGLEAAATAAQGCALALGAVPIILLTHSVVAVAAWVLAVSLAKLAVSLERLRRGLSRAAHHAREAVAWRTVLAFGLTAVSVMVYLRADSVMVGWLLSKRHVGWYAAAYTLLLGLQIAPYMVARALIPVFARTHAAGERAAYESAWHLGVRAVLLIALPLSLAMTLLAGPVIRLFFGGPFHPAAAVLAILVWSSPLAALNTIAFGALRGAGEDRWLTSVSTAGAVMNVGLNLWAIPTFGIDGAAGVTVATETAVLATLTGLAIARGLLPWPRLPYVRLLLALAALAGAVIACDGLPVAVPAAAGLLAFALTAVATRILGPDDLEGLRGLARARAGAARMSVAGDQPMEP